MIVITVFFRRNDLADTGQQSQRTPHLKATSRSAPSAEAYHFRRVYCKHVELSILYAFGKI